jgi:hypothetical protein
MIRNIQSAFSFTTLSFAIFIFAILIITVCTSASAQYATVGPNGGVVTVYAPTVVPSVVMEPSRVGISLGDRTGIANYSNYQNEVATIGSGRAAYNGAALGTSELPAEGYASEGYPSERYAGEPGKAKIHERDGGTSVFVGEGPIVASVNSAAGGPTLAEMASRLKTSQRRATRTYTNADAQRINDNQLLILKHPNQPNNAPPPQPR